MGWINEHLRHRQTSEEAGTSPDGFIEQARRRWLQLAEELKADVAEFNAQKSGADFSQLSDDQFMVTNSISGVALTITADFSARIVRYEYAPISQATAGAPEGGMLSMRQTRGGKVDFYSSDERLTSEETREVLLEPVLFPPQMAA
jgi:hypothetical protein